jgi:hypothetical protein
MNSNFNSASTSIFGSLYSRVAVRALILSFALLCSSILGFAQVTGAISGTVQDASQAPIQGVTVTVHSLETGLTRTVETNESGRFNLSALPLGPTEVRAEKSGFKKAIRGGLSLAVGQEAVVNLTLEIGDIAQQVTVTAEAPVVNTTTAAVAGLVGERQVKDLPLNGRSFDNLLTLNPGALSYGLKSPQTSTSNGNTFAVSGRRPLDNIVLLNGVEYGGASQLAVTPGGVSGTLLGIDAVREFNVLTDTYSAEYGKRAGAQVTVVTQSGSNQIHGSLFEFLRNSAMDARSFLDQGSVPPFRRNQFGGAIGGPIKKDKLFVFGNYEGFRQSLALSSVSVVPNAAARNGLLPDANGNLVQVANLNPLMLQYARTFWPDPNGRELGSGVAQSYNNPKQAIHENFGTMRMDYNMRAQDTLAFSYTMDDGDSLQPLADPLFASASKLRSHVASLQETHIFSPRSLNMVNIGFSRAGFNLESSLLATIPASLNFVSGAGPGGIVVGGGATTTGAGTITSAGPNNAAGVWNRRNLFTYSDTFQTTRGKHQISMGLWFQRLRDNENSASRQLGQATFTSLTTFLQGTVSNFQVVPAPNALGWRSWFSAWFVEDNIKLSKRLNMRVGLRHEITNGFNEVSGRAANYVPDAAGILQTAPVVSNSVFTENKAKKLFSPRIGLAYDPFGNGRTAIRAGFGLYYTLIDNLAFLVNSLPPANGSVSFANVSLQSILPITPSVQPAATAVFAPQGVQSDANTPAVAAWNFTIEQQIDSRTSLRMGYVGSHGYHIMLSLDPNSIPAQICSNSAGCQAGGIGAAASQSKVAQGQQYIPVGTRPNPRLSGGFFWYTEGNSSYNALQMDVTRRLTAGLQFRGNYTWSKNLDMNSGLTGAQSNNQAQMIMDRNDLRRDWGPSALNVTHQGSVSVSYELPFGKGKSWLGNSTGITNKLVSGWQINTITTMLGGFPFTPQVGANRSGNGDTRNPDRPNVNPAFTGTVVTKDPNRWYDPTAFSLPAFGTWGNLGRSVYEGPGLASVDLSLLKTTALTERTSLQFRAEAFNLLNHTNLGTPNAIVFSGTTISPSAGLITTSATTPRQMQMALKLVF